MMYLVSKAKKTTFTRYTYLPPHPLPYRTPPFREEVSSQVHQQDHQHDLRCCGREV